MSNQKVGEYIPLYGEDDCPELVRGHVSVEAARDAMGRWDAWARAGITDVAHKWARWIPTRGGEFDRELHFVEERGRGVFAVTEIVRDAAAIRAGEREK